MTLRPQHVDELSTMIRDARTIRVRGAGTKASSLEADDVMDVTGLSGILDYSAEECVLTANAGTPLRDIVTALAQHGQYLPFDPPFADAGATIGGTVASGLSGPGRYRYGGVRDFVIGVRIVDGEGRVIRSGGKVVKNAAGFLLHHGIVGSCGRFGVLTEVTLKVFPAPEARRTMVVDCGSVEVAFVAAQRIEGLRYDCEMIDFDERGTLRVTIAGRETAIDERAARLAAAVGTTPVASGEGQSPGPGTVPGSEGQSPLLGTVPEVAAAHATVVKVAGVMNCWQKLRGHVGAAHFMCAGAVGWITTTDLPQFAHALDDAGLVGQVIGGARGGARIGRVVPNEFEERVRGVLDPKNRFSAAPYSGH